MSFADRYRPRFHFSPKKNFMNDPNGLIFREGVYHLFFQHNPYGNDWGHMSWGHAVSDDLFSWEEQPVALLEEDGIMVFSGCAVFDRLNTSGLSDGGTGPVVLVYSGQDDARGIQTQNLAYSTPGGGFTKYHGNPVLDIGAKDFRDPHVFWHASTQRWIMVVAYGELVRLYDSADLMRWDYLSDFSVPGLEAGTVWECPHLLQLPVDGNQHDAAWILAMSVAGAATAEGSGMRYFIGSFDGREFVNADPTSAPAWVDYGADFFAAQSFSGLDDGRYIWLGWMSNWAYAGATPTQGWRGCMSIPREISLTRRQNGSGIRLRQQPVKELEKLRKDAIGLQNLTCADGSRTVLDLGSDSPSCDLFARLKSHGSGRFGVGLRTSASACTDIGYDINKRALFVDRRRSGNARFHERFPALHTAPLDYGADQRIDVRIVIDACSVEVFADDGAVVLTDLIFPESNGLQVELFADEAGSCSGEMTIYPLMHVFNA